MMYVELLARAVPTVITSEEEYDLVVAIVDRLAVKRDLVGGGAPP